MKGDLLISGVVETELGGTHLVRADGIVLARTHHTERFIIPKKRRRAVISQQPEKRYAARLFGVLVPLTLHSEPSDRILLHSEIQAEFKGERASIGLVTERIYGYTVEQSNVDCDKAFENERLLCELFAYSDRTITARETHLSENDDYKIYTVEYTCEENIASPARILLLMDNS